MYFVYVLKSQRNGKRYVGSTGIDVQKRLYQHNHGTNQWTKQNGPFILIYSESIITKTEAIKREKFLKSGKGREWLDKNTKV